MSKELWAVEPCEHDKRWSAHPGCSGGINTFIDFDAIWDRYYEKVRLGRGTWLTRDELRAVIYGGLVGVPEKESSK